MSGRFCEEDWSFDLGELTEEIKTMDGKTRRVFLNGDFISEESPKEKLSETVSEMLQEQNLELLGQGPQEPDYKYDERKIMEEVLEYIDGTYSQHYVHEEANVETGQLILADKQRGLGFCIGNVIKYADRYGKKSGYNRADLFKVIHYAVMALSINISVDNN